MRIFLMDDSIPFVSMQFWYHHCLIQTQPTNPDPNHPSAILTPGIGAKHEAVVVETVILIHNRCFFLCFYVLVIFVFCYFVLSITDQL
jgi:hypothetical protein